MPLPCVRPIAALLAVILITASAPSLHAQLPDISLPTIAYGSHTAREIIKEAEDASNRILGNAELSANRVLTDAALKLNVLARNLQFALEDSLDIAFKKLGQIQQNALLGFKEILDEADREMRRVERFEDNLDIDLNRTLDRFAPFVKAMPFYISRLEGAYQVHQLLDYAVIITGKGFGPQDWANKGAQLKVFINGIPLDRSRISVSDKNTTLLRIPFRDLEKSFSDTDIRTAWLYIESSVEKRWQPFSGTQQFKVNLPIVLFPKYAAVLSASATYRIQAWDVEPVTVTPFEYPWHGLGAGNNGHNCFSKVETFDSRARVYEVKTDNTDYACGWCVNWDASGLGNDQHAERSYEVVNNEHWIRFRAACNGDLCRLRWLVRFQHLGSRDLQTPVATGIKVAYGDQFDFDLPSDAIDWIVEGQFYSGQKIKAKKGNPGRFLTQLPSADIGGKERVVLVLQSPFKSQAPQP